MRWANITALWLLLAAPAALLLFARSGRMRRRAISVFGEMEVLKNMFAGLRPGMRRLKAFLFIAALGLTAAALARPQEGTELKEMRVSGRDVVFALDVSKSMLAQDVAPSRIKAAKAQIAGMAEQMAGDRIGLVIFAGEAFLQCPLTVDNAALRLFLDSVQVGSVPKPGTNIADAIRESMRAFSLADSRSKTLVLLTDGEDHGGKALEMAKEAAKNNVQVYTVGLGSAGGGAPIPIQKEDGGVSYKLDNNGKTVMSALDETTLQKIAMETGGKYYYGGDNLDLSKIYSKIAKKKGAKLEDRFYTHYEDRYQWLLIPALLMLMIEMLISEYETGPGPGLSRHSAAGIIVLLLPFLMAIGGPVAENAREANRLFEQGKYGDALALYNEAQLSAPEDPRLHYNIGATYYKQEKYDDAIKSFEKALTAADTQLKQRAYYNLGNCHFKNGVAAGDVQILAKAVDAYEKALELNPDDQDAKYNLEVARRMIELKKNEQPQDGQQQRQQGGQGDQQKQPETRESPPATGERQLQPEPPSTGEQKMQPQPAATGEQQAGEQQPQGGKQGEMSREDAEMLLRALEDRERDNLEKRFQGPQGQPGNDGKDW